MNTEYFYDTSDTSMFPPKPKPLERPKGMITISLNFIFYLLLYFLVFNGNLKLLAAVLMVMFIHEFGHFVLMKRYGYADKRMFFIPLLNMFFKEEEHQEVSLKEKLLILMAGPVPGLLIGFAALVYGDRTANEQVTGLAWIFLVWNLINLVPLDMLDGGMISETLYPRSNFAIQLAATILVTVIVIAFVFVTRNYFSLIIPAFLIMKVNGMNRLNVLRTRLEGRGLDLALTFDALNNKQYWLIRKELLDLNRMPGKEEIDNEFSESIYEGMIMQNIKTVLLNRPYNDLGKNGKLIFTIIWIALLILPLVVILTGPWVK